jgi:serine/threonine protein kinase
MALSSSVGNGSTIEISGDLKKWRLRREKVLGKGSFGLATLYKDEDTGELVVVKDMNLQCMSKASDVEALHNEIKILKKTADHPNIVHYIDSAFDGQFSMQIVMEYCDAGDLAELIERSERSGAHIPETQIRSILVQVLMGLYHLHHDHRILHRDLKPQNIFLRSDGVAKIGDFGVSTMLSTNVEFAKTFCGSPFYLAPELCEEKRYNGKADVWSVGVMLYEMVALHRPFQGKTLVSLIFQITKAEYPALDEKLPYSTQLRDIVTMFLQLNPEARPTLKRVLRGPYVAESLPWLPSYCIESTFYEAAFPDCRAKVAQLQRQWKEQSQRAQSNDTFAEMEAWASEDKEKLKQHEKSNGLKEREVVDTTYVDRTVTREMMASTQRKSPAGTAGSSGGTMLVDDDDWNSYYGDDFEEDDDVVMESTVRLMDRSFKF